MKITLIISSMTCGGAERVMSIIANYWADRGEDVTLVTLDSVETDFYTLEPDVRRIGLCLLKKSRSSIEAIRNNFKRIMAVRKTIVELQPDVVISFMARNNTMTLLATRGLVFPVIVSEHTDPRQAPTKGIWGQLRLWIYSRANAVVVLTNELRWVLSGFVPDSLLNVIPNPALPVGEVHNQELPIKLPSKFVVAMGRLIRLKGFDLLLEAFSRCNHDDWSLVILGEGSERRSLELLADKLGIADRVYFPGNIAEPNPVLLRASLFVLSSRYEGFPMALIEAMSCGLPAISFDCPTGPSDIIRNGVDGVLVPAEDMIKLASSMNELMADESLREKISSQAVCVIERFSLNKVMLMWDELLDEVTG